MRDNAKNKFQTKKGRAPSTFDPDSFKDSVKFLMQHDADGWVESVFAIFPRELIETFRPAVLQRLRQDFIYAVQMVIVFSKNDKIQEKCEKNCKKIFRKYRKTKKNGKGKGMTKYRAECRVPKDGSFVYFHKRDTHELYEGVLERTTSHVDDHDVKLYIVHDTFLRAEWETQNWHRILPHSEPNTIVYQAQKRIRERTRVIFNNILHELRGEESR